VRTEVDEAVRAQRVAETKRSERRQWRVAIGLAVVAVGITGGIVALAGGSSTPISEQSCSQLSHTWHRIDAVQRDPNASTSEIRQSVDDSQAMNARADELGCVLP
jgi:hypothetical protein